MPQWIASPEWKGETVYIVAGGPSVARQDVRKLEGRKVIAVNSSYEVAPFAPVLFFNDKRWWDFHRIKLESFAGRLVTVSEHSRGDRLFKLRRLKPPPGFSADPGIVASQRTSLQGAINLAYHLNAGARIVLLGADMCRASDGRSHHHTPHIWRNKPGNTTWDLQMEELALIVEPLRARGVEVINTSLESRLDWWPKMPLESCL